LIVRFDPQEDGAVCAYSARRKVHGGCWAKETGSKIEQDGNQVGKYCPTASDKELAKKETGTAKEVVRLS